MNEGKWGPLRLKMQEHYRKRVPSRNAEPEIDFFQPERSPSEIDQAWLKILGNISLVNTVVFGDFGADGNQARELATTITRHFDKPQSFVVTDLSKEKHKHSSADALAFSLMAQGHKNGHRHPRENFSDNNLSHLLALAANSAIYEAERLNQRENLGLMALSVVKLSEYQLPPLVNLRPDIPTAGKAYLLTDVNSENGVMRWTQLTTEKH